MTKEMNSGPDDPNTPDGPAACELLPQCVICDGRMEIVYERAHQKVCQCMDCGCTLTVPASAWPIASAKRRGSVA